MPVSMIPTRTPWLPRWRLYDFVGVALIIRMSHCRSANGSAGGTGAPRSHTAPLPAALSAAAPVMRSSANRSRARARLAGA